MRMVTVRNDTRDTTLAQAEWRGSVWGRARGLLGRGGLAAGEGIVITPCSSVHMCFMRFAIDVLYLDREGRVVKTVDGLRPWRFSLGGTGAHQVVELTAGTLARAGTQRGDLIVFCEGDQARRAA